MLAKTSSLQKHRKLQKRVRISQGGSSAGKTLSILWLLLEYATKYPNKLISVCAINYPHLRRGAMRDFKNILDDHSLWGYYKIEHNVAQSTYTFFNGTQIEFIALNEFTARGARRDVLFINECNLVSFETYQQLEIRTKEFIWLDFNPTSEFWAHTDLRGKDFVDFIITTYKDNEKLDKRIVESIESRKHNKNWWRVYGEGQIGELEGLVYSNWKEIDTIPDEAEYVGAGVDFGFTNDPTAIVGVYKYNNGFILDEICYKTGLHNSDIAEILKQQPVGLVVADSAEPKSISEIKQAGYENIIGVTKTSQDRNKSWKRWMVEKVGEYDISYTSSSTNLRKEYLSYMWKTDKTGKTLNEPMDGNDHLMDALGYRIVETFAPKIEYGGIR